MTEWSTSPTPRPSTSPHPSSVRRASLTRRQALGLGAGLTAGLGAAPLLGGAGRASAHTSPGLVVPRPSITHGVAAGDVRRDGALIWSRADRPSHMIVEVSTRPDFVDATRYTGPAVTDATDGTGSMRLVGLPSDSEIHYRVSFEDDERRVSEPVSGSFRTAPTTPCDITLQWSGDVAGQGYGINPDVGGMYVFREMAARTPDLFLHSGDVVYADGPIEATTTDGDDAPWHNITAEHVDHVAQELADFRARHAYNYLDEHYRAFFASTAAIVQWDDHEVVNNWYPGEVLDDDRFSERSVDRLAERAHQAFHEWQPVDVSRTIDGRLYRHIPYGPLLDVVVLDMRSYKDDNRTAGASGTPGRPGRILGEKQAQWLVDTLASSRATWKIVAADLPLGLVVPDGDVDMEGVANGTGGAPTAREHEIAWVLRELKRRCVRNVVWLTADVHYTAAHHYSPERATWGAGEGFDPFWEFVSGPLNAGAFGPNDLDPTFGPEAVFVHAPGPDRKNVSPLDPSFQHFGEVRIDGASRELTVDLCTGRGNTVWTTTLTPDTRVLPW